MPNSSFVNYLYEDNDKMINFIKKTIKKISLFNKVRGKRNNKILNKGIIFKSKIIFLGKNNIIEVTNNAKMWKCRIVIHGSNNKIVLGKNTYIEKSGICIDGDNNNLIIGENCIISKDNHFSIAESTSITIGNNCLMSANIHYRTTDSHSILNNEGKRINFAKDIIIHDHVWICANASFLKGSEIKDDSIVSYGAVVTKRISESNCVVAGVPANIVKKNISWDKTLIKQEK